MLGSSHWVSMGSKSHAREDAKTLFAAVRQLAFPCWIQTELLLPLEPRTDRKGPTQSNPHCIFWRSDSLVHPAAEAHRQTQGAWSRRSLPRWRGCF